MWCGDRQGSIQVGERFGRLVVLLKRRLRKPGGQLYTRLLCQCDCGGTSEVGHSSLRAGTTLSCGCIAELISTPHGDSRHPLYKVWTAMIQRCTNERNKVYPTYGGRGISVCPKWMEYPEFKRWSLQNGYKKGLGLDREDNEGDYCPSNCRFVTPMVNSNNVRLLQRRNTSGFRGASYSRQAGKFSAVLTSKQAPRLYKTVFNDAESAARYRDAYCIAHGVVVPLNFPQMTLAQARAILGEGSGK